MHLSSCKHIMLSYEFLPELGVSVQYLFRFVVYYFWEVFIIKVRIKCNIPAQYHWARVLDSPLTSRLAKEHIRRE